MCSLCRIALINNFKGRIYLWKNEISPCEVRDLETYIKNSIYGFFNRREID
ncbi:hypothetical protein SBF1_2250004 [Candidatus Desulfosporosinus infrequens]|uniref:Uncharacterized protein n=1 Tax=Candidatus Desulfosporosinus infrequens TaxID=2043169 RepID=A0A2U3KLL1_9FIRM|nr:hypothetical protein SBF1_2250004 [Candidatus Desulfosporosinus infrequens]